MNTELERIKAEALKLRTEERERLIEMLIDSLDQVDVTANSDFGGFASAETRKSWTEEIERRIQRIRNGQSKPIPVDDALANVRARLKVSCANLLGFSVTPPVGFD